MSDFDIITINLHYRGVVEYKDEKFGYKGGNVKLGMKKDPDYLTWSLFGKFCAENGSPGEVEEVWYKLPEEDMDDLRCLDGDRDEGIRRMCALAKTTGKIDLYIDQSGLVASGSRDSEHTLVNDGLEEGVVNDGFRQASVNDGLQQVSVNDGLQQDGLDQETVNDGCEQTSVIDEQEETPVSGHVPGIDISDQAPRNDGTEQVDEGLVEEDSSEGEGEGEGDDQVAEEALVGEDEEGEDIIEEVRCGDDPRFRAMFDEVSEEEAQGQRFSGVDLENGKEGEEVMNGRDEAEIEEDGDKVVNDDENELERQCKDPEHPDPALDSDEEWHEFNKQEKVKARKRYNKEQGPYLWLLQTFSSGGEFKDQLLLYVLKTQFDVKLCRWEKTKLGAICTNKKCPWRIYCSVEKSVNKWMVKKYVKKHNHLKTGKARMLKTGVIGRLFRDEARRRPGITWTDIKDEIMIKYNISVSKYICQQGRRLALDLVIETQMEQFAKLWDYEAELRRSNPGVTTEIVTIPLENGREVFNRFYICFEPLRKSWKSCCSPIIGLDGAFLKWELKGEILAAVGRDADNMIYPIAWAIVRVEDNDSWVWFVDKLRSDLNLGFGNGFTFLSDEQKGLINALQDILPNAEHRHCARHIFANWKKVYNQNEYESYFWDVAYSASEGEYNHHLGLLREYDDKAAEDFLRTTPTSWCRAFISSQARCEDICNNLSESFTRTIKEARKLPVIDMLEEVRRLAMGRISRRRIKTKKCETEFPPHIMEIYEFNRTKSIHCSVLTSGENLYEVVEHRGSFEVNLRYKHCACNQWNLTGIPCRHAIYVINEHNRDPAREVDKCFLTSKWQETYADNIKPVNGEMLWRKTGKDPILIPEKRRLPRRPRNHDRIKEPQESSGDPTKATRDGRRMTCSKCKQVGHNKATCTGQAVPKPPPGKRGRPKKIQNNDPWSINNAPNATNAAKRRRTMSQPIPQLATSDSGPQFSTASQAEMHPSTAPSTSGGRRVLGRPPGPSRGRGRGRANECGTGGNDGGPLVGRATVLMSPWTSRVFTPQPPQAPP